MSANSLKLIKDLDNYKFIYYWACPESGKVSPDLPTLLHAGEWICEYQTAQYKHRERRKVMKDRRRNTVQKNTPELDLVYSRRLKPEGRRVTDTLPVIDLDMTPEKFNVMKDQLLN
ncbi:MULTISPECIES: hypothetical protein [unclassified Neptuniibacter]|uniref:hypothetical protein n=1 Tax=unclassified Neptuniibacter TaxID=2630693 RepID=UPI000C3FCC70|nr:MULTISPECIES: hypothetical protein [unclassified Neptuniibacter]MAY42429.1 hypothetical protein [Oceanospirillaceae bacterium]|tara:strand:+ start:47915 stop:48262 length:348 start_codon:yes stop_codon:yes gene_type:complete